MTSSGLHNTSISDQRGRSLTIDLASWLFWLTFFLSFLVSRPLIIATNGVYRIGLVVFFLGLLLLFSRLRLVNRHLLISISLLAAVALLSGIVNRSSIVEIISFVRIPLTAYLIYYLVAAYFTNKKRVTTTFRFMYVIALIQLPILLIQRLSYPYVPARLKFSEIQGQLNQVDFAMGTFEGDAPMSFFLIGLLILLLFYKQSTEFVKYKWFMAIWMTLTVIVGNSQIQHIAIVIIWLIYFLTHRRIKTVLAFVIGFVLIAGTVGYLDQSGILTFSPLEHTRARASKVFSTTGREDRIEVFLSGEHARDGAIYYYLQQPLNLIGDGPGRYYNTVTRERTLGTWGHLFTFYAEVGLVGWTLSMLVLFIVAFPFSIEKGKVAIQVSWVQLLMFLTVLILTVARYPMNTIPMIFVYCVILIGYGIIAQPKQIRIH